MVLISTVVGWLMQFAIISVATLMVIYAWDTEAKQCMSVDDGLKFEREWLIVLAMA